MFKGARKEGMSLGDKRDPARVTSRARIKVEIRGDNPGGDGPLRGMEWLGAVIGEGECMTSFEFFPFDLVPCRPGRAGLSNDRAYHLRSLAVGLARV